MYNHEPDGYNCPFCRIIQKSQAGISSASSEIVCQAGMAIAFLGLRRWPNNPLDVLIVPNHHIENIYDLPSDYAAPLHELSRAVALALKALYACDGTSLRQHNEPAGNQDVWHYHIHLTPRFTGDGFQVSKAIPFPEAERHAEAKRIRDYVQAHRDELFEGKNEPNP